MFFTRKRFQKIEDGFEWIQKQSEGVGPTSSSFSSCWPPIFTRGPSGTRYAAGGPQHAFWRRETKDTHQTTKQPRRCFSWPVATTAHFIIKLNQPLLFLFSFPRIIIYFFSVNTGGFYPETLPVLLINQKASS